MDASAISPLLYSDSSPLLQDPPENGEIRGEEGDVPLPGQVKPSDSEGSEDPKRRLGFYDGVAIVLGLQIGSGIFASPSLVARNAGSEPVALLIWCLAGLLAWACAACYIELGTRLPVNGGPQEYLAYCFNDLIGFLASWGCIFAVKPCSAAILALFISDYLCDALDLEKGHLDLPRKLSALFVIALIATVNCSGNKHSNITTKILLACKTLGVGFVIAMGFAVLIFPSGPSSTIPREIKSLSRPGLSNYTDATLQAMWAYSGWETLAFVGGELKDPGRNMARVINVSMTVVMALSVLANIAYFSALSFEDIIQSTTIGLTFSQHFLGHAGGALYAVVICLSTLGTLNVKTFTAGRLTQAAAERKYLPRLLKTVERGFSEHRDEALEVEARSRLWEFVQQSTRFGDGSIPFSAIIFNSLLAAIYVLFGDFGSLVTFIGIVEYSVAFVTLLGLLTLRLRLRRRSGEPLAEDAGCVIFRVPWLLIFVALAATSFIVSISVVRHPVAGIGCTVFCVVSVGIYKGAIRA